jgi:hypothetical protein
MTLNEDTYTCRKLYQPSQQNSIDTRPERERSELLAAVNRLLETKVFLIRARSYAE